MAVALMARAVVLLDQGVADRRRRGVDLSPQIGGKGRAAGEVVERRGAEDRQAQQAVDQGVSVVRPRGLGPGALGHDQRQGAQQPGDARPPGAPRRRQGGRLRPAPPARRPPGRGNRRSGRRRARDDSPGTASLSAPSPAGPARRSGSRAPGAPPSGAIRRSCGPVRRNGAAPAAGHRRASGRRSDRPYRNTVAAPPGDRRQPARPARHQDVGERRQADRRAARNNPRIRRRRRRCSSSLVQAMGRR